jgi:hypothetical protein
VKGISRVCDECNAIKRCRLYLDRENLIVYLCRRCARELGFEVAA